MKIYLIALPYKSCRREAQRWRQTIDVLWFAISLKPVLRSGDEQSVTCDHAFSSLIIILIRTAVKCSSFSYFQYFREFVRSSKVHTYTQIRSILSVSSPSRASKRRKSQSRFYTTRLFMKLSRRHVIRPRIIMKLPTKASGSDAFIVIEERGRQINGHSWALSLSLSLSLSY